MGNSYKKWKDLPYAGEHAPPHNPVTPRAGSWPTFFLSRGENGEFKDPFGKTIKWKIKHPDDIDWGKELTAVQHTLTHLTPHKIKVAEYWGTGVATKQFTPVADRLIDAYDIAPTEAARILSYLHGAVNDTFVVTWHLKYLWDVARPNQYDQNIATVLCTPRFPAYPSGHAAVAGCAEVLLGHFFPPEAIKLKRAAEECALSRLYAGVHFSVDNEEGLQLGRQVGHMVVEVIEKENAKRSAPIDPNISQNRHAEFAPHNYQQFIPYKFNTSCTSKVLKTRKQPRSPW